MLRFIRLMSLKLSDRALACFGLNPAVGDVRFLSPGQPPDERVCLGRDLGPPFSNGADLPGHDRSDAAIQHVDRHDENERGENDVQRAIVAGQGLSRARAKQAAQYSAADEYSSQQPSTHPDKA